MRTVSTSFLSAAIVSLSFIMTTSCSSSKKNEATKAEPTKAAATEPAKSTVAAAPEAKKDMGSESKGKKSGHHKGHNMKADTAMPAKSEASEKAETSSAAGTLTCKNGADTRTLEVATVGAGCETRYTKSGESKAVATAKAGTQYCQQVSDKIKANIEGSGFKCN